MQKQKKDDRFKASRKIEDEPESNNDMDEIEANFVRNLKKGSRNYKGKLPSNCSNCGRIFSICF